MNGVQKRQTFVSTLPSQSYRLLPHTGCIATVSDKVGEDVVIGSVDTCIESTSTHLEEGGRGGEEREGGKEGREGGKDRVNIT